MAEAKGGWGEKGQSHILDKARSHGIWGPLRAIHLLLWVKRKGEPIVEFGRGKT